MRKLKTAVEEENIHKKRKRSKIKRVREKETFLILSSYIFTAFEVEEEKISVENYRVVKVIFSTHQFSNFIIHNPENSLKAR